MAAGCFLFKAENNTGRFLLPLLLNPALEVLACATSKEKMVKAD